MKKILFLLLISSLAACHTIDRRLEYALEFAGENRIELENVLEHYKDEPEKLEAARFLIRNMPRWYAYEGWQLDSIEKDLSAPEITRKMIDKWKGTDFFSLPKVYDAHVITADYLIENIELAFEVKKYPWNRSLPFEDFCELILPYRIGDEPLSHWRILYHDHYAAILDSAYRGSDVVEACKIVGNELKRVGYRYRADFRLPHMDAVFLFHHRIGWCREACDLTTYSMRACGIPSGIDFFWYAPDYQHYHVWTTLRDTTGKYIQFGLAEFEATREEPPRWDGRKKGKVYRYCFGWQEEKYAGITEDKKVPSFLRNRFIKDVTSDYFGENEVQVPIGIDDVDYIYLGVFSPEGWIPVDMTKRKGDKAVFRNIEPNIIYQPLYSDGREQYPAGYPFIYTKGKVYVLKPDTSKMESAVLKRKMSIKPTISAWLYQNVIGSKIEAADNPNFKNCDLLYAFKDTFTTSYNELVPYKHDKCRYVRYVSPAGKRLEVAELALYEDTLCDEQIALHRISDLEPAGMADNITDGSGLTYCFSRNTSVFVAYDLKKEHHIKKIVFMPWNDDNYVWPGDRYELFYQDGINGWKSLGTKTATKREIEFMIPGNALLWLRDLTKGREEQIFIHRDGKQVFTIDL